MGNGNLPQPSRLTADVIDQHNLDLATELQAALQENKRDVKRLRRKLTVTFWVIIVLSCLIFALGILLLSVPVISAYKGEIDKLKSIIAAGFGIADLVGLVLYGPIEKIHKLMGDMSQLILALNSNQTQVSLRLLEMDVLNRPSIGIAADKIGLAAENSIKVIQEYFENSKESK